MYLYRNLMRAYYSQKSKNILFIKGFCNEKNYHYCIGYCNYRMSNGTTKKIPESEITNAKKLTKGSFGEIVENLPKDDKFVKYSGVYKNYIDSLGVYYTDMKLSYWNQAAEAYELPSITINEGEMVKDTYQATNSFGAEFEISRTIRNDDVILLAHAQLQPKSVDDAKKIDGNKVRVYYKFVPAVSKFDNGTFPSFDGIYTKGSICGTHRSSVPTSDRTYDWSNNGCQFYAVVIKGVNLKTKQEIFPRIRKYDNPMPFNSVGFRTYIIKE